MRYSNLKNSILIFLPILFLLSSCGFLKRSGTPYFMGSGTRIPNGSPIFQRGYIAGCSQSLYNRGNLFYKMWYKAGTYEPKYNNNSEYRFGYKRGVNACFIQAISPKGLFPYKDDNGFVAGGIAAENYNNTVGGMFGGLDSPFGNGGDVGDIVKIWGGGSSVFNSDPLWASGSKGQFFGQ